jgi:hypothetical protein
LSAMISSRPRSILSEAIAKMVMKDAVEILVTCAALDSPVDGRSEV